MRAQMRRLGRIARARTQSAAQLLCAASLIALICATPPAALAQTNVQAAPAADDEIASYAKEAAKAARRAAEEAKAAALEARTQAAAKAAPQVPPAGPAAVSNPGASDKPAKPTATAAIDTTPAPAAPPVATPPAAATGVKPPAIVPKIVLTPAKKLFGAAKTAANLTPRAIGGYANGCLSGGRELAPDTPNWQAMRLSRNRNWGHPKLIALLERFAQDMKTKENWPGLLIGDLAQPRGGPMLTGHKSHQVGLDADIWFKPKPEKVLTRAERETFEPLLLAEDKGTDVIAANWNEGFVRLVKRAASYPEVERIFVHPAIKKEFCKAAGTDRGWLMKVRPMWLHNYHFHVRMECPAGSAGCTGQKPPPNDGDGCGKELTDWLALVSAPPKPQPVPAPPPATPKPEMTLNSLPRECRSVLVAGEPKDSVAVKGVAEADAAEAAVKAAAAEKAAKAKAKAASKAAAKDP